MSGHRTLLDVLTADRVMPEGCDIWGVRSVYPDGASSRGFVWPLTPGWVEAPGPLLRWNPSGCPRSVGDGLCVAQTWHGMASGGIPATTVLLVAWHPDDVLGWTWMEQKYRVRRVYVAAVIDGVQLVRDHGRGADLSAALLTRADLAGADLTGVNLTGADLTRVNLTGACLRDATLRETDLYETNFTGADLTGANLWRAHIRYANLNEIVGADFTGATMDPV